MSDKLTKKNIIEKLYPGTIERDAVWKVIKAHTAEMKEYSVDEIRRLLPEMETKVWERNLSCGYPSIMFEALMDTRSELAKVTARLEVAVEALGWVDRVAAMDYEYRGIAREALAKLRRTT